MKKPNCFISYNQEDNDINVVMSLVNLLTEASENKIQFLIDENLPPGADLESYMNSIEEEKKINSVIVLLTPGYKRKVDERIDTGVYKEFKSIVERLEEELSLKKTNVSVSSLCLIPIIFARSYQDSCPKYLQRGKKKSMDFTDFFVKKNGKLGDAVKLKYSKLFQQICSEILTIQSFNNPAVNEAYENLVQKFEEDELFQQLFNETKQDNLEKTSLGKEKELYVKTHSFENLRTQKTYFFLGRKGSGKTTLAKLLYLLKEDKYKEHIDVNIDTFNLEYIINVIMTKSIKNDIGITIRYADFFKYIWEIYIFIRSFMVLIKEDKKNKLSDKQKENISTIKKFVKKFEKETNEKDILKNNEWEKNPLFQWCVTRIIDYYDMSIQKARESNNPDFNFDINNSLIKNNIFLAIFGNKLLNAFYYIVEDCNRKFFISFDGFDTMFENFRMETIQYKIDESIKEKRSKLEVGFLEGFLLLINEIKASGTNVFHKKISVCVTVPKDRFFEIKNKQRDSYRYIGKFHEVKWSGIELSIMLRKRLERLNGYKNITDKKETAQERLEYMLNAVNIPSETEIRLSDNKVFKVKTFLNVIRHSFWRPREILLYYAKLITIINDLKRRNLPIDNFAVSKSISEVTFQIIDNEFISEFKNYCLNLSDIIGLFKDSKQIISPEELKSKIGTTTFSFVDKKEVKDIIEKIDFLFEIGFIGIEVSPKIMSTNKFLIKDIFCFNASTSSYENIKSSKFQDCNFIIHSIFCEYLGLNLDNQDRLIMDIDWEYLQKQDVYVRP